MNPRKVKKEKIRREKMQNAVNRKLLGSCETDFTALHTPGTGIDGTSWF